jgi:hypothetical protein
VHHQRQDKTSNGGIVGPGGGRMGAYDHPPMINDGDLVRHTGIAAPTSDGGMVGAGVGWWLGAAVGQSVGRMVGVAVGCCSHRAEGWR